MKYSYRYPRPAMSVDCVVFGFDGGELKVLLIERLMPPFQGSWALPGGFLEMNETLDEAARRELKEETSLDCAYLEQLYTFSQIDRDPRERVVTVAYFALVKMSNHVIEAASDARAAEWFPLNKLPDLAFDHSNIFQMALDRLKNKIRYQPIGFELLPKKFTLRQLQALYEAILQRPIDKRNFRKKVLGMEILVELEEREKGVAHRAARYYRFDSSKYRKRVKEGFLFEVET